MTTLSLDETRAFLASAASWSDFAASLYESLQRYGQLTPRQQAAAESMAAKLAARAAAASAPKPEIDLAPIHAMFDKAKAAGLNKLAYRACGLVLWPAPATGKNPGAIYVKRAATHSYLGKVQDSRFTASSSCTAEETNDLLAIAADPAKTAREYGKRTEKCSCCGRELSDEKSIEMGIGPICAAKWGL